jgi:excisionase family DNA binding protein
MSTPTASTRPATARAPEPGRLLSVEEVAARLGTTVRFPRRLIEERRIEFVRIGRHVRIAEHVLAEYIAACSVPAARPAPQLRSVAS